MEQTKELANSHDSIDRLANSHDGIDRILMTALTEMPPALVS